jgi:hypothetical protein
VLFFAGTGLWAAHWGCLRFRPAFTGTHGVEAVRLLESYHLKDYGVLVAPTFALDYVLRHYPVRYAFVPRNDETLRLLAQTYPVNTVILGKNDRSVGISEQAILEIGLVRAGGFQLPWWDAHYVLFKRPP